MPTIKFDDTLTDAEAAANMVTLFNHDKVIGQIAGFDWRSQAERVTVECPFNRQVTLGQRLEAVFRPFAAAMGEPTAVVPVWPDTTPTDPTRVVIVWEQVTHPYPKVKP